MIVPKFLIDPHKAVGPIRFGMPRPEVARSMKEKPFTIDSRKDGYELSDYFQGRTLQVVYDANELSAAVQFFALDEVVYPLDVRMNRPYREILRWARERDPAIVLESDGFRSELLGIVAGVREKRDDEDDAEQKLRLLVVYRPHYYKTRRNGWQSFGRRRRKRRGDHFAGASRTGGRRTSQIHRIVMGTPSCTATAL